MGKHQDGKDGTTRRNVLIKAAGGAAAIAGAIASAQAQTGPKKIRAVAVGSYPDTTFNTPTPLPSGPRPYIAGLVDWLADTQKSHPAANGVGQFLRGTGANNYVIEYRERAVGALASAFTNITNNDLLFCMSTSVGDAAIDYLEANNLTTPMVVISSHFDNFEQSNVCVVSAERPQLIRQCYNKFKNIHGTMTKTYALHRADNFASADALRKVRRLVTPVAVADSEDPVTKVQQLNGTATDGLLVLPADRFFAVAAGIVTAAGQMPTYWTTPDWPSGLSGHSGAFGYPQNTCGRYMAERVARIWMNNNQPPNPKDVKIPASERDTKP